MAGVQLVEVAALHVEVKGPFAPLGLDPGHPLHLARCLQVLEILGLVNEQMVDSQFVEDQPIVLLLAGQQVLEPGFAGGLLLLEVLADVAVGFRGVGRTPAQQCFVLGDLFAEELLLVVPRHADPIERALGDDDAVPVAAGDLGRQHLAAVLGEVVLGGDQQLGVGVELLELAGELLQHVVGDDVEVLVGKARLLHLHAARTHHSRLASATTWASRVLPPLITRQMASVWCGRRSNTRLMPGNFRCEPSKMRGRMQL